MSETEALRALMEADRWMERVSARRTQLPEITELSSLEVELRGLLHELRDAEALAQPVKKEYESVADASARLRRRGEDLDATLTASTANSRELSALQKELTHVRALLGESEDRELELLLALESCESVVSSIKARAQPGVMRRSELVDITAQLRESLDDELETLVRRRNELAAVLSVELRSRYDAAKARAGTSGASQVLEGRCDGCRLALSPLDYDHWRSGDPHSYMDCPECGRLLMP